MPSAAKYLNFFNDPSDNDAAPPVGAPENATQVSDLNNIDRYDKAAIADLAQDTVTEGIGAQTPDAVAFTGGAITNLTTLSALPGYNPTADVDFATKFYVDQQIGGVDVQSQIDASINALEPVGTVKMWNGAIANLPTFGTWQLCDGTNGTIDLTNVILKGCDVDGNLGSQGGSQSGSTNNHSLTQGELPAVSPGLGTLAIDDYSHGHFTTADAAGTAAPSPTNKLGKNWGSGGDFNYSLQGQALEPSLLETAKDTHAHTLSGSLANLGSGQGHNHSITIPEPVHRRIYFIQRTA